MSDRGPVELVVDDCTSARGMRQGAAGQEEALCLRSGSRLAPKYVLRPLKSQKELSDEWAGRSIKKHAAPGGMTTIPLRIGTQFATILCLYRERE
jgi:hypothetical protein